MGVQDSDDDFEEIYEIDTDAGVITLDENDDDPGMQEAMEDLDFEDDVIDEENGYIEDDSTLVFTKHEGSVFCTNFTNKTNTYVVSGGEDDKGYVWNVPDGEVVFECDEHKDSVVSCGFSADDKYVMTADMGGTVIVRTTIDGKKVWDFECDDIEWCKWHTTIHILFAGTTSLVYMWKIPSGDFKVFQYGAKAVCSEMLVSGKEIVIGYDDGTMKLWDLKTATALFTYMEKNEPILCVAAQKSGSVIACGTENGNIRLCSVEGRKLVSTMVTDVQDEETRGIEVICFSPADDLLACVTLSGMLEVWDLASSRIRFNCEHPHGVSRLIWDKNNIIITGCLNGEIRQFDGRNGTLLKLLYGNREAILDMTISSDQSLILTGGDDQTARIFSRNIEEQNENNT